MICSLSAAILKVQTKTTIKSDKKKRVFFKALSIWEDSIETILVLTMISKCVINIAVLEGFGCLGISKNKKLLFIPLYKEGAR